MEFYSIRSHNWGAFSCTTRVASCKFLILFIRTQILDNTIGYIGRSYFSHDRRCWFAYNQIYGKYDGNLYL